MVKFKDFKMIFKHFGARASWSQDHRTPMSLSAELVKARGDTTV